MTALTYFTVTADWVPSDSDGSLSGVVTFSMLVQEGNALVAPSLSTPGIIVPVLTQGRINDGVLYGLDGSPGVSLLANTDVLNLATPLLYEVSFSNLVYSYPESSIATQNINLDSFIFQAETTNTTIDLSAVAPAAGVLAAQVTSVSSVQISDATTLGRELLTATSAPTARGYLDASAYLGSVSSQSAMLALTGNVGDYCYRSDLSEFYYLLATPASTLANWDAVGGGGGGLSAPGAGIVKSSGTALETATAGTDYAAATSGGPNMLASNGAGGFEPADWVLRQIGAHQVPVARTYWGNKANTSTLPTTEDTGQATTLSVTPGATGIINSGLFTMTPDGASAAYWQFNPSAPVTRIGCRFILGHTTGSTTEGAIALAMLNETIADLSVSGFTINAHLSVYQTGYALTSYTQSGGFSSPYLTGTFATPLSIGDTVYEVEMFRVGDTVTLALPDGSVVSTTNSAFTTDNGNFGFVETVMSASTDNVAGIQEHWWDTSTTLVPPTDQFLTGGMFSQQLASQGWRLVNVATASSTATLTASTLTTVPNVATISFTAPPTGQVLCKVGVYLDVSSAATIYLAINGSWGLSAQVAADTFTGNRYFSADFLVTGLTPGSACTAVPQVMSTASGTSFNVDPGSYYNAIVVVEPIVAP